MPKIQHMEFDDLKDFNEDSWPTQPPPGEPDPFFDDEPGASIGFSFESWRDAKERELLLVDQQMNLLRLLLEEKEVVRRRIKAELDGSQTVLIETDEK